MNNNLTERLEIRLTRKMKYSVKKIGKRYDVSLAEVIRMGLIALELKESGCVND